uniref:PL29 family lyase N-terminal domain-containing protein n=1 Tax=Candidatus Cryptobacteroides bacterium TaxID=3085639 RepID=UPI00402A3757
MKSVIRATVSALFASALMLVSCGSYDDTELKNKVNELENRVAKLESAVNANTQSILALVEASKSNDAVTGFSELNDKSGYIITFASGKSITLYHGKNGSTPAIGVKADSDGIYYWTVDGEWLLSGGKKVKAEGKDAVTPKFKIENDNWFISQDGGKTWTNLGKAKEKDIFKSVSLDGGFVNVVLADGTAFKIPVSDGSLVSMIGCINVVPTHSDGAARVIRRNGWNTLTIKYEVLPSGTLAKLSEGGAVKYSVKAFYTATKAAVGDVVDLEVTDSSVSGDFMTVKVKCDALDNAFFDGSLAASVSLHVSDGIGEVASAYTPIVFGGEVVTSKVFNANDIVLSLGVVSDVHVNPQWTADKWKSALQQLKAKALENDPDGLAGVLVAGDLIDNPNNTQLSLFKSTLESELDVKKTPLVYTVGNHDVPNYAWAATMPSDVTYMRNLFGDDFFLYDKDQDMRTRYEARHCVVGDYHIFSVSPNGDQPIVYDPAVVSWLDSQLAAVTSAEPDKYVILITHPMIKNTVYGSRLGEEGGIWSSSLSHYWATDALTPVLKKYPQVIVFGGHLHFPLNDPRSVWQGDFTVFGCGSVRYMAIENGKYEDMSSATVMKDCNDFSQGNLLQFDSNGNMRVLRMDFWNKDVIGEPVVSSYPTSDKSHLTKYNHTTRSLANAAPVLSTLDVDVTDGVATAKWAAGTDDEFVHHYVLTLRKGGTVVTTKKILADFYKSAKTSGMKKEWTRSLGNVTDGTYELTLEAYDSWDAAAKPLTKTFQVGSTSSSLWTDDKAGSDAVSGGNGTVSNDWLTYADGKVSWTANTTGKPRTAKLTLPDATEYSVTQISVEDFKGSWTLYSKLFDPNKTIGKGTTNAYSTTLTFGEPLKKETLKDVSGTEHANNLGVKGLYFNAVMDGTVKIDYESQSVNFGIFLDRRTAQDAGNGRYMAFLPELNIGNAWGALNNYVFAPGAGVFSDNNYEWLWFSVSKDFSTLKYLYEGGGQKTSKGGHYICGISCVKATSTDASTLTTASYDVIYQANYNNAGSQGMYFTRN